jgi:predicted nucleic acid-binding protein
MRRLVVDAAAVLAWFDTDGAGADQRRDYEAGEFAAVAPPRIHADMLAAIARRDETSPDRLARIAAELPRIGIQVKDPPLTLVAAWIGRGLDGNLAPYAALAEHLDMRLDAREPMLRERARSLVID